MLQKLGKAVDGHSLKALKKARKLDTIRMEFTGGVGVAYMMHTHFWIYAFYGNDGTETPVYQASSKDQAIRRITRGAELLGWSRK
jgi:hypothetical protein